MPPVEGQRYAALDLIRGLSILGILIVNAIAFAQPMAVYGNPSASLVPQSLADLRAWWFIETFFRDKFVTSFSLLFGISLYLVGRDLPQHVPAYRTPLFRRLAWLALFGFIHGALIWQGDILLLYAICGFVFWRWRHASVRRLLTVGLLLFLVGAACQLVPSILQQFNHPNQAYERPDIHADLVAMRGDFLSSLRGNYRIWARIIPWQVLIFLPSTCGLMMMGLGLFQGGFLKGTASPKVYAASLAAGVVCLIIIGIQTAFTVRAGFPYPQIFGLYRIANTVLCLPVALGYASGLILVWRTRFGQVLLHPLVCAGRLAFSNYLMQSLVMTVLFYGGRGLMFKGLGWYGTMNAAALIPIVVSLWTVQLIASTLWLKVFRYGPFEWLWRSLTFNRLVDIRVR